MVEDEDELDEISYNIDYLQPQPKPFICPNQPNNSSLTLHVGLLLNSKGDLVWAALLQEDVEARLFGEPAVFHLPG